MKMNTRQYFGCVRWVILSSYPQSYHGFDLTILSWQKDTPTYVAAFAMGSLHTYIDILKVCMYIGLQSTKWYICRSPPGSILVGESKNLGT
jgi:hypothetical protein